MARRSAPGLPLDPEAAARALDHLKALAADATTEEEVKAVTARIRELTRAYAVKNRLGVPATLIDQATALDPRYRVRPHLQYLSDRITAAVADVEAGQNRLLAISMPPRAGKSTLLNQHLPVWLLRRLPRSKIVTASYDGGLTYAWAKSVREVIEGTPSLGLQITPDGGAGGEWSTTDGGSMYAVSVRGSLTGRGATVLILDDVLKDFLEAHSPTARDAIWNWWLSVSATRLEGPYLVLAIGTRWHEDDFLGRLFSPDHEGDSAAIENISIPAIAEEGDLLGRAPGEPLLSPLADETPEEALKRWDEIRRTVGSYVWAALYQQHPSSPKGAIFDTSWWRFWTMDPAKATQDGRVRYIDPSAMTGGRWLDSWDCNFDANEASTGSWVVGQRWVRSGPHRYLIAQQRKRWNFTQTLEAMRRWAGPPAWPSNPCANLVHQRLIEKKANGAAILNVLAEEIPGLKPITPKESKTARARSVTPEVEGGNVYLPHPGDPGNEWVMQDLLPELRDFPNGFADDQTDSLTQALAELRDDAVGRVSLPGRVAGAAIDRNRARAAATGRRLR